MYLAAAAGALHFIWKEKVLTPETVTYFVLVVGLLGYRVAVAVRKKAMSTEGVEIID